MSPQLQISQAIFEKLKLQQWPLYAGYPYYPLKALRRRARSNFPAAFISFCKTKKIKWLILLLGPGKMRAAENTVTS